MKTNNNYSIRIDVTNATNEYRIALYRLLNNLHFESPDVFNYTTLGLDNKNTNDNK
jgi:hypothetical protein